ncbi:hypothetical protein DM02DRAFT_524110, partial [Periconia macrospinosa]
IAIKALNNIVSLNSFISTLFIFSAYLRINSKLLLLLNIVARVKVINKVIYILIKKKVKVDINYVLNIRNSLVISNILTLSISAKVLV